LSYPAAMCTITKNTPDHLTERIRLMQGSTRMKKMAVVYLAALMLLLSGCRIDDQIIIVSETPPADAPAATAQPSAAAEKTPEPQTSIDPKLYGNLSDAPGRERIAEAEGYELSAVLTSDSLEYEVPLDRAFAVALKEDVTKGNRWMVSSEDGNFELARETHIDGYRVFIFRPLIASDTFISFELASAEGVSIEILTYHVTLG